MRILILFTVLFSSNVSCKLSLGESNVYLLLSKANTIAPYSISDGRRGIVPDIYKEIFTGTNYKLKLILVPDARLKKYIQNQKYKNWVSFGSFDWYPSSIYLDISFQKGFLTRSKSVLVVKNEQEISELKKSNLNLVAIRGFVITGLEVLRNRVKSVTRVRDTSSAFKMLLHDRADAYIHNSVDMAYALTNNTHLKIIQIPKTKEVKVRLMFDSRSKNLKKFINKRMETLETNGTLNEILTRYQVEKYH